MFKDDRMISILSGIVLMLAIGTLVQRQDSVSDFFSGTPEPIMLNEDVLSVEADTLTRIDVLANDGGTRSRDADRLSVLSQPDCGRVFVQDGALQFLAERDCEVQQTLTYGLTGDPDLAPGVVNVTVLGATGVRRAPEPSVPADVVALAPSREETGPSAPAVTRPAPAAPRQAALPEFSAQDAGVPVDPPVTGAPSVPRPGVPQPSAAAPSGPRPPQSNRIPLQGAPSMRSAAPAAPPVLSGAGAAPGGLTAPSMPSPSAPSTAGIAAPSAPSGGSAPFGGSAPVMAPASPSAPAIRAPSAPSVSPAPGSSFAERGPAAPAAPGLSAPGLPAPGLSAPGLPTPGAPGMPDAAPQLAAVEPSMPIAPGGLSGPAPLAQPSMGGTRIYGASRPVEPGRPGVGQAPAEMARPSATIALAQVEVPSAVAAPSRDTGLGAALAAPGLGGTPTGPRLGAGIDGSAGQTIALAEPTAGLGDIMSLNSVALTPIDTSEPERLATPRREDDAELAALTPPGAQLEQDGSGGSESSLGEAPAQMEIAALPEADLACVVPPSVTLDIRAAGETELMITSPCHAGTVAEITYLNLSFGVPIDRAGRGALTMLGFEPSSAARIVFADGEKQDFDVPFTGVDRVERVALAWSDPIRLDLHAFEFGAELGEEGHVHPGAPRNFQDVRRRGGGYMTEFQPVDGVGQSIQVYTHWVRRGGTTGVVKMNIDFASRHRERLPEACGDGPYARPSFTVVRSARGRLEEPNVRRLGAMACEMVDRVDDPLISAAVRDIIISQR